MKPLSATLIRKLEIIAVLLAVGAVLTGITLAILVATRKVALVAPSDRPPTCDPSLLVAFQIGSGSPAGPHGAWLSSCAPTTFLWTSLVSILFFCLLMWQVRVLLNRARLGEGLLTEISTALQRIAWLAMLWPIAKLLETNLLALGDGLRRGSAPHHYQFAFNAEFDFPLFYIGVVLLVVRSVMVYLQSYYEEMKLVV